MNANKQIKKNKKNIIVNTNHNINNNTDNINKHGKQQNIHSNHKLSQKHNMQHGNAIGVGNNDEKILKNKNDGSADIKKKHGFYLFFMCFCLLLFVFLLSVCMCDSQ